MPRQDAALPPGCRESDFPRLAVSCSFCDIEAAPPPPRGEVYAFCNDSCELAFKEFGRADMKKPEHRAIVDLVTEIAETREREEILRDALDAAEYWLEEETRTPGTKPVEILRVIRRALRKHDHATS